MRRIEAILLCLWVVANSFAATYQAFQPTDFRSTSAYMTAGERTSMPSASRATPYTSQSLSAISASNFATLNSEGGACYHPSAIHSGPKKGKVVEPDTEAVGEGVWESPVGDIPWMLIVLLLLLYLPLKKEKNGQ